MPYDDLVAEVKNKYSEYNTIPDVELIKKIRAKYTLHLRKDSIAFFLLPLNEFKERLRRKEYRYMFFIAFEIPHYQDSGRFMEAISNGFKFYDNNIPEKKMELASELSNEKKNLFKCQLLGSSEISSIVKYTWFILFLTFYPIRLCILLIIWAIRTLKT